MKLQQNSLFIIFIIIPLIFTGIIFAQEEKKATEALDSALITKGNKPAEPEDSIASSSDSGSDTITAFQAPSDSTSDTAADIRISSDISTDRTDSSLQVEQPEIDTSYRVWKYPFWSFGFGWELGSMPVFDLWNKSVKNDSILTTRLLDRFAADSIVSVSIVDQPTEYTVCFPLSIGFTPVATENNLLYFGLTFSLMRKNSKAQFEIDSTTSAFLEQSLSLKTFFLGVKYHFSIPLKYFNIDKFENSFITLGVSGSPLLILREWFNVDNGYEEKRNSYGIGVKWHAGVITLRRLSQRGGLEVGIIYNGSWNGRFMHDGHHIMRRDIYPYDDNSSDVLQFLSHRFIISFSILAGKKEHLKKSDIESATTARGVSLISP